MNRQLSLYEDRHETLYELRQPDRNMTHCPGCDYMVWEDEMEGGLCPTCTRQHHAEIPAMMSDKSKGGIMKKRFSAHHRTTANVRPGHKTKRARVATRKREKPIYVAHAPVAPSPLPCLYRLMLYRGDGYILVK